MNQEDVQIVIASSAKEKAARAGDPSGQSSPFRCSRMSAGDEVLGRFSGVAKQNAEPVRGQFKPN